MTNKGNIPLNEKEAVLGKKGWQHRDVIDTDEPLAPYVRQLLEKFISQIANSFSFEVGEVYLKKRRIPDLVRVVHHGEAVPRIWKKDCYEFGKGLLGQTVLKVEPSYFYIPEQGTQDIVGDLVKEGFKSLFCFPIRSEAGVLGLLCLVSRKKKPLSDNDKGLIAKMTSWLGALVHGERRALKAKRKVVVEERERIGMDLHDGIIQSLYAVGLMLQNAHLMMQKDLEEGQRQVDIAIDALNEAIRDIRAYILDLRPHQLQDEDLFAGIQSLIREFCANTFVEVELQGDADTVAGLPKEQIEVVFHIFQEALANVAKHANATKVTVRLWKTANRVMIKVNDDGCGFDLSKVNKRLGHGLSNMRTRADAVGGGIEIISIRHQGSTILAWVPNE